MNYKDIHEKALLEVLVKKRDELNKEINKIVLKRSKILFISDSFNEYNKLFLSTKPMHTIIKATDEYILYAKWIDAENAVKATKMIPLSEKSFCRNMASLQDWKKTRTTAPDGSRPWRYIKQVIL